MWKRLLHWAIDHASWDLATSWLWAAGGGVVTTAAQSLYAWWIGHPNATSLLIGLAAVVLFVIGAIITAGIKRTHDAGEVARPRPEPENAPKVSHDNTEAIRFNPNAVPRIRVDYVPGQIEKLIVKNDNRDTPGLIRQISKLRSRERYETDYILNIVPNTLPPVDANNPIECKLFGVIDPSGNGSSLQDVMRRGAPESMDSVVIDYDDEHGNEFSRVFVLSASVDGTIAWTPDPVALRGQARTHDPGIQSLAVLRQKLGLANAYQRQHDVAQQFAAQLQEAQRDNQKLINTRTNVEIAGAFTLLAYEAGNLRDRLRGIRIVLDRDSDKDEMIASEYPLREMKFITRQDRQAWTVTHIKMFLFQHDYAEHRSDVLRERRNTGFTSEVTNTELSLDDSNTPERVVEMLDRHAKELAAQAAKLTELP